jgi:uncharacterized protein YqgC (DUF456 family)
MEITFLAAAIGGTFLIIAAFVGCILPALPGPPLGFLALLILKLAEPLTFSSNFMYSIAGITIIVFGLDYILPIWGAKIYKATKMGIWFSVIGMIIGIFIFPPFGMILGLLIGAIIGELAAGKAKKEALKVGFVSFIFSMLAIIIKLALVAVMAFYFTKAVIEYYI